MRIRNNSIIIFLLLFVISFTSCENEEMYYQYHSFTNGDWNKEDACLFEVDITDTTSFYNVDIEVRNNNEYSFRNLWLFVEFQTPDGRIRKDTLDCELADDYGKWYGNGITLYTLVFPFESGINYPHSGKYTYSIKQGMRAETLRGITDIGLKISKKNEE